MKSNKELLFQYAGFATQLLVGLGVFVFVGLWIDKYFFKSTPIFVWLLPLFLLISLIIKVIKDTSK